MDQPCPPGSSRRDRGHSRAGGVRGAGGMLLSQLWQHPGFCGSAFGVTPQEGTPAAAASSRGGVAEESTSRGGCDPCTVEKQSWEAVW